MMRSLKSKLRSLMKVLERDGYVTWVGKCECCDKTVYGVVQPNHLPLPASPDDFKQMVLHDWHGDKEIGTHALNWHGTGADLAHIVKRLEEIGCFARKPAVMQ